jgi:hypothetical protein
MALNRTLPNGSYLSSDDLIIEAVNELLETIGEFPVATIPTSVNDGTVAGRALSFLERANIRTQAMGWPENMIYAKTDTATNILAINSGNILGVQGTGKDGHRTLGLRKSGGTQEIYDADAGTTVGGSDSIQVDVIQKLPWDDLSEHLRENIVKAAAMEFQRRLQGSQTQDAMIGQERQLADARVPRNDPVRKRSALPNAGPMFGNQPPAQEG